MPKDGQGGRNRSRAAGAGSLGRWWQRSIVQEGVYGYLLILPALIGLVLFDAGPIGTSLYLSFTNADILTPPKWLGLANYTLLFQTDTFYKALRVSATFAFVAVPVSLAFSLLLSVILNQNLRGKNVYRLLYYLPAVCSSVAVAMVWVQLYHPQYGILNWLLRSVGLPKLPWLNSTRWALPSVMIIAIWGSIGPQMVVFLAGLQGIPASLYEAAEIDGANRWENFLTITVPLISPSLFFLLVTGLIGAFQAFELSYVATGGGPAYATYTIAFYIFQCAFNFARMRYASAMAYVLAVIVLAITLIQFAVQKRWVYYE